MSKFTDILNKGASIVKGGAIPYNYKVGEKGSGKALPFDVKLSLDPDMKKTVTKVSWILGGSIALGIAAGIIISNKK